ncbi:MULTISPECIES: hypothetical protein [unclassified Streptomyces]|uniref:hypothetical protein n=1 Tax=unclassified Streptomyces TaxID=2593676 RepID=UPI002DDC3845|nr:MULTISPECIES: hypothetical protein [unclassified Streptomyces]WSA95131.1 hypothetical protein OIE63_28935 [Streptomyces sp. NBC_01795]WSB79553.1 hypothetical protein OHB04_30050 [Streptomyces sp. NBC_01775]WSS12244.1 hypothetical protein OG533_10165 [Streptomyces sp. NBC_01186]WSS40957.1 hypothetical protein OG220_10320 [Streptomyces sp. NBC_01187]
MVMPERGDAVERLVRPGHCVRCGRRVREAMTVAMVQGSSGPGRTVDACLPHAREYAAYALAPQWLRDDLAALDAARLPARRAFPHTARPPRAPCEEHRA